MLTLPGHIAEKADEDIAQFAQLDILPKRGAIDRDVQLEDPLAYFRVQSTSEGWFDPITTYPPAFLAYDPDLLPRNGPIYQFPGRTRFWLWPWNFTKEGILKPCPRLTRGEYWLHTEIFDAEWTAATRDSTSMLPLNIYKAMTDPELLWPHEVGQAAQFAAIPSIDPQNLNFTGGYTSTKKRSASPMEPANKRVKQEIDGPDMLREKIWNLQDECNQRMLTISELQHEVKYVNQAFVNATEQLRVAAEQQKRELSRMASEGKQKGCELAEQEKKYNIAKQDLDKALSEVEGLNNRLKSEKDEASKQAQAHKEVEQLLAKIQKEQALPEHRAAATTIHIRAAIVGFFRGIWSQLAA